MTAYIYIIELYKLHQLALKSCNISVASKRNRKRRLARARPGVKHSGELKYAYYLCIYG